MRPTLPDGHDVEVVDVNVLDHPEHFDAPWLVIFANGKIDGYETEEDACRFQREWREANGMDPLTGEAKPTAPPAA